MACSLPLLPQPGPPASAWLPALCPRPVCKPTVCACVPVCPALQLCLPLCNPMHCREPGCAVYGIFQAGILEWVAMPSSGGELPYSGIEPASPALQVYSLLLSHKGSPQDISTYVILTNLAKVPVSASVGLCQTSDTQI